MALKANTAVSFSLTLKVGGVPIVIPETATVTAQIFDGDGEPALSPVKTLSSSMLGADWPNGVVAIEFSDVDTADITPPDCIVLVTVTESGSSRTWRARLKVEGAQDYEERSRLFTRGMGVAALREEIALSANGLIPGMDGLSDDYLWGKLKTAEAAAERRLRVFFGLTEVLPEDAPQAEVDALVSSGARVYQEAAYDYDPEFFRGERWGFISVRQRPIRRVHSIKLAYPTNQQTVFDVPNDWIRTDKKYGVIRLVPATGQFAAPLSAFILQTMGGGRTIPMMLQVRYQAGLDTSAPEWEDLLDAVRKSAILKMLQSTFPASSGSISADGLSQSRSVQVNDWSGMVDDMFQKLYDSIHPLQMGAMTGPL